MFIHINKKPKGKQFLKEWDPVVYDNRNYIKWRKHRGARNIHIIIPLSRWLYKALSRLQGNGVETSLGYRASAKPVWVTEWDPVSSTTTTPSAPTHMKRKIQGDLADVLGGPCVLLLLAHIPASHSYPMPSLFTFVFHLLLFFMVVFLTHSSALLSCGFLRNCLDLFGFYFTKNKGDVAQSACLACTTDFDGFYRAYYKHSSECCSPYSCLLKLIVIVPML